MQNNSFARFVRVSDYVLAVSYLLPVQLKLFKPLETFQIRKRKTCSLLVSYVMKTVEPRDTWCTNSIRKWRAAALDTSKQGTEIENGRRILFFNERKCNPLNSY